MRKKLKKLETVLGDRLFVFEDRSLRLTAAGQALQAKLTLIFGDVMEQVSSPQRRQLRLAVQPDLLDDILAREVIAWARKDAGIHLLIVPQQGLPETPADVTVWLSDIDSPRPNPGFALTRPQLLGRIGYMAHVASRYAGAKIPASAHELADFLLVQHSVNKTVAAFAPWNRLLSQRGKAVAQVHTQSWVHELVRSAGGIGLLPSYAACLDKSLRPLSDLFTQPMERTAWMAVSPLVAQEADVTALVSVIQQAFEKRSAWFSALA